MRRVRYQYFHGYQALGLARPHRSHVAAASIAALHDSYWRKACFRREMLARLVREEFVRGEQD